MKKYINFGKKIRSLRLKRQMTQRELAVKIGVDVTYISKIERSQLAPPSERVIKKMAKALGCEYENLMLLADKVPTVYASRIRRDSRIADFLRRANSLTELQWKQIDKIIGSEGIECNLKA